MFEFLKRFGAVLRRPLFQIRTAEKRPEEPVALPILEPVTPPPARMLTPEEFRNRWKDAELRLHVSIEDTHRGAKIEYHVGPAEHPFRNRFADRTVSFKIPKHFQDGLREHFLKANEHEWELQVPRIGFIDYQFEKYPHDRDMVAVSGSYHPKSDVNRLAESDMFYALKTKANLVGLGTYLELKSLGYLKKMGVTHLRTSYQMVDPRRQRQLIRRKLEPKKTYGMKEWATLLASKPEYEFDRHYRAA